MDGMTPADKLVQRAAYFGHTAVAITDHGVAQAYPDAMNAQKAVEKSGKEMKILYGVEGYLVNDMVPAVVGKSKEAFDGEFIIFDLETTRPFRRSGAHDRNRRGPGEERGSGGGV